MSNSEYLQAFIDNIEVGASTKRDYVTKLTKLSKDVSFDDTEENLIQYLNTVDNPNTRSNKAFALIRLRRYLQMPTFGLETMRDKLKTEIREHRKTKARADLEKLISYDELLQELDKLSGRDYVMNYMWVKHGLRNKDINVLLKHKKPSNIDENTAVCNPKAKKPIVRYYIVDYKTAPTYGDKSIVINDQRFFDELLSIGLKDNDYLFAKQDGSKSTVNYMNVLATTKSINNYGEVKIAKILIKHLLDTKQFSDIEIIARQRGTALSTIYTSYNIYN